MKPTFKLRVVNLSMKRCLFVSDFGDRKSDLLLWMSYRKNNLGRFAYFVTSAVENHLEDVMVQASSSNTVDC